MLKQQIEKNVIASVDYASGSDKIVVSIIKDKKVVATFEGKGSLLKAYDWVKARNYKMIMKGKGLIK